MDKELVGLMTLRGLATLFTMTGARSIATAFTRLADSAEAGVNVDERMAEVAELLKSGGQLRDWEQLGANIISETNSFLAR